MTVLFTYGALGDFVLTFPLMRALAELDGEPITLVAASSKGDLARHVLGESCVADTIDADSQAASALFAERSDRHADGLLAPSLSRAARVVSFVSAGDDAWAANVAVLAPQAERLFVKPRPGDDAAVHVAQWHRDQLAAAGLTLPDVPIAPRANAAGPLVIHPGSGGTAKVWPTERFITVAEQMRTQGRGVRWLIGEVEHDRWPANVVGMLERTGGVTQPDSFCDLFDAIRDAWCFVGNDSGPTHLAAQAGVPTIALFGPTSPVVWRPVGPQVAVIAPDRPMAMDWLSVRRVLESLPPDC